MVEPTTEARLEELEVRIAALEAFRAHLEKEFEKLNQSLYENSDEETKRWWDERQEHA